jgi:hypothetical protein
MNARSFVFGYLGTIWTLLAFGTLLWLVGQANEIADQREALEIALQQSIDNAVETLEEGKVTWEKRVQSATDTVAERQSQVDSHVTEEDPEPTSYAFRRAVQYRDGAQESLNSMKNNRDESITGLEKAVTDNTTGKTERLAKFDEDETIPAVDWVYLGIGLLIGLGLLGAGRMREQGGGDVAVASFQAVPEYVPEAVAEGPATDPGVGSDDEELELEPDGS